MTSHRIMTVDVFTATPLKGNPVAVVFDADELDTETMQAVAGWTNLSETTFVTAPTMAGADYAVRIFTPRFELPFAGHPTLGTAHAVLEAGFGSARDGRLVQQCQIGLVELDCSGAGLSFRLPRYALREAPEPERLAAALGGDVLIDSPKVVDVGPHWVIAEMASAALVENLVPDLVALGDYDRAHATTGLTVFAIGGAGDITVRSFAPTDGIIEDPVCGSGNAAVAAYRIAAGQIGDGAAYVASQGRQVGRDGRVRVKIVDGAVHVGGDCVTCVTGTLTA